MTILIQPEPKVLDGPRHDLGELGHLVILPGFKAVVAVVTFSDELIENAWGSAEDLASLPAASAQGLVKRIVYDRIVEARSE